ncbi:cytochrome P450 [Streptomyces sp. NRRL S-920]|uniref:cytochrome P450 n=1 Tax=Streptomyces sp. NRRL S-920 TaxID=1463921 RepID=UPI0004CC8AF1|nr:cytochrome P450 [Streptomyces sp. NRRL S-920]
MGTPIPGPEWRSDGGVGAVAGAGGLHLYQLALHERYGPVVRFQLPGGGSGGAVSIADPVLLEATAHVDKRPAKLFEFLAPLCEAGNLQVLDAEEHGPWRRLLLSVLAGRPSHERHFAGFTALVTDLADRWAEQADRAPVALQKDLTSLSLRMICEYALGGAATSDIVDPDRVTAAFEDVLVAHLGASEPVGGEQRGVGSLAYLRATVDRIIAAYRRPGRPVHGDRSDLIGALLAAGERPARIRDTVMVTLLAAHHTTGVAVSWALHLLGRHPDVAARVADELDRVLGERAVPDYADLRRLTYLDMVLKESMRLYPPGPYGAREATEDFSLGGYGVPAGTTIFYPFWAIHMNPAHWPDPGTFRPERFTPEAVAARPKLAYVPFGLGPRSCEGAGLAMVEAELMLAVLLKRFRFRPVPGHEVTPVERFVLWAADDIRMTVTPRGLPHHAT